MIRYLILLCLFVLLVAGAAAQDDSLSDQLDPETVLIVRTADFGLQLLNSSFEVIHEVDMGEDGRVGFIFPTQQEVFYSVPFGAPELYAVDLNGEQRAIPLPGFEKRTFPNGMLPAPDGSQIAWLYQQPTDIHFDTPGAQNAEGCGQGFSCTDRDYTLVVTDGNGENPQVIWEARLEDRNAGVFYQLYRWNPDLSSILLTLYNAIPSPYYPTVANAIYEITLDDGVFTDRNVYSDGVVVASPDTNWVAQDYYIFARSREGMYYEAPPPADVFEGIGELTFSPDSKLLAWVALLSGGDFSTIIGSEVRILSVEDGSVMTAFDFGETIDRGCLPWLGVWLNDRLLLVNYAAENFALDVITGETFALDLPEGDSIVGVIAPGMVDRDVDSLPCEINEAAG